MARSTAALILSAALLLTPTVVAAQQSDRITAAIVVKELKSLGFQPEVTTDDSDDPLVNFMVDGYRWSVYFFDCAKGERDSRQCSSYQFYTGYIPKTPASIDAINRWNTDERYTRAYAYVGKDQRVAARLELDVRAAGTGANASQTFRLYFNIMKDKAIRFRKLIGMT